MAFRSKRVWMRYRRGDIYLSASLIFICRISDGDKVVSTIEASLVMTGEIEDGVPATA